MKVDTVNVIEYVGDSVFSVNSFMNSNLDSEANMEAEECFKKRILEIQPDATEDELEVYCEDGWFEEGDVQVFLTHSI